jgi:uncharacterized protein with FMN-binding domain
MKRTPIVLLGTVAGVAGVLMLNPEGTSFTANGPTATGTGTGSTTGTATPSVKSVTATGDPIYVNYGYVQLKVTAKGGTITKIVALQLPDQDGRSIQISGGAEPLLREQALTAQSAKIAGVSGATFTSGGYQQSLQSALDKLGIK